VDDEFEPKRTIQTAQWLVSSTVVASMDELEIAMPLESAITSQVLDVEHQADPERNI